MKTEKKYKIGILAFGSLIDNPGAEIQELSIDTIDCETPFKVEFARVSSTRGNAPTLIPVEDELPGRKVKAKIIVLKNETTLQEAIDILYRRECHKIGTAATYTPHSNPTSSHVLVEKWETNLCGVENVIYTRFLQQDEHRNLTPEKLADFAIESILSEAGRDEKDGIRYLLSAKQSKIKTELSDDYEKAILKKTQTSSLNEAIEKLDREREKLKN